MTINKLSQSIRDDSFPIKSKLYTYILEIKKRTAYIVFSFFSTFAFSYWKWHQLCYIFLLSFYNEKELQKNFIFTDVTEAFSSVLWVCCIFCFLLVLPFFIYQLICFLIPSWYIHEKYRACFSIFLSLFAWYFYLYLMNYFFIPQLCAFFLDFQINTPSLNIVVQPKIYAYLLWASSIMAISTFLFLAGIIFFVSLEHNWIHISGWSRQRPLFFFLSILIAAFISPPEIWSEAFLAFFIYTFLELLIWVYFIIFRLREIQGVCLDIVKLD